MDRGTGEIFVDMNDGAKSCRAPAPPGTLVASDSTHLVIVEPHARDAISARISQMGMHFRPYRALALFELEGSAEGARQVAALPGVVGVVGAMGTIDGARTYANGIDVLLDMALAHNLGQGTPLFKGLTTDDGYGYPVLGSDGLIHQDPALDWPTPPPLFPVMNLSVGPGSPEYPTLPNDIVNAATADAIGRGVLVVMAAGNCGTRGEGTVSAWARVPWVLAVGATEDPDGTRLADYSATGRSNVPGSGPDVVAYGVSSISPHPVGTSFAAPRVTFLARLVSAAICQLRREVRVQQGERPQGVPLIGCGFLEQVRRCNMEISSRVAPNPRASSFGNRRDGTANGSGNRVAGWSGNRGEGERSDCPQAHLRGGPSDSRIRPAPSRRRIRRREISTS